RIACVRPVAAGQGRAVAALTRCCRQDSAPRAWSTPVRNPVTPKVDFDVLIIGGGMVGACLAALAASDRTLDTLRIALLEPHPPTVAPTDKEVDLRVSAISRGSQRLLETVGAWQRIAPRHLGAYTDMIVWDSSGTPGGVGSIHFAAAETSEACLGHIVENR